MTQVKYLSTEDLLELAQLLGVLEVRDVGLLDSAALRPQSVVFGAESYPMLADKGAALLESIVGNHPLVDGNKRLGWAALVSFYALNGIYLELEDDVAYEFVIGVASGELRYLEIATRLASWAQSSR
ncbi:death-on-curing protein [Aurantimicrobium minutum]|uniref:type II toxin-antitoxin system death-on-curing family toxin n=1 Tax=Aurantimicrobium minutum TaxID=708131 RepID=UPI0024769507|nr:type II toxin-antitoxin system death-on-curing family toxin [Aurantimicrobium minutum]MDH6531964.1 death-on-curing protein [Aurantimicrobium minutum]